MIKNFVKDAIHVADEETFNRALSDAMHIIKFFPQEEMYKILKYRVKPAIEYTDLRFERLCRLATIIEYRCNVQGLLPPKWVTHKFLFVRPPYFADDKRDIDVFLFAPQACMNHNVFYSEYGMDVK